MGCRSARSERRWLCWKQTPGPRAPGRWQILPRAGFPTGRPVEPHRAVTQRPTLGARGLWVPSEILNDVTIEFVLCECRPLGYWSMHQRLGAPGQKQSCPHPLSDMGLESLLPSPHSGAAAALGTGLGRGGMGSSKCTETQGQRVAP